LRLRNVAKLILYATDGKNRQEFGYVVLKFADVLHYATALKAGCKFFITNDTSIRSIDALEVIFIKDFVN
jgi:predicted nucleic acid-binding protein